MSRSLAQLVGEDDNYAIEAAARAFNEQCARIEQIKAQHKLTPIELRKLDWQAGKRILVEVVEALADVGLCMDGEIGEYLIDTVEG